jgi:hypothetical protein
MRCQFCHQVRVANVDVEGLRRRADRGERHEHCDDDHCDHRREPSHPSPPPGAHLGCGPRCAIEQQRGDQEAGQHEEQVDPDEAPVEVAEVVGDDHRDGDGAQPVQPGNVDPSSLVHGVATVPHGAAGTHLPGN